MIRKTMRVGEIRTSIKLESEFDRLGLAGNTQDLTRVLEACPMPCLILDAERAIRQLNRAFALWLNLDPRATVGKRLDNIMILRATQNPRTARSSNAAPSSRANQEPDS